MFAPSVVQRVCVLTLTSSRLCAARSFLFRFLSDFFKSISSVSGFFLPVGRNEMANHTTNTLDDWMYFIQSILESWWKYFCACV